MRKRHLGTYFATPFVMRFCLPFALSALATGCFLETDREVGPLPDGYKAGPPAGAECVNNDDCSDGQVCFNLTCVGDGSLRFSLAFETDSDFDLHVKTPLGNEIYYANRRADGGYLDVDQCVRSCGGGTHVENVYFEDAPPPGNYEFWVLNFDGRAAGPFSIEVTGLSPNVYEGSLPTGAGRRSEVFRMTR